jgi:hypothetical protein
MSIRPSTESSDRYQLLYWSVPIIDNNDDDDISNSAWLPGVSIVDANNLILRNIRPTRLQNEQIHYIYILYNYNIYIYIHSTRGSREEMLYTRGQDFSLIVHSSAIWVSKLDIPNILYSWSMQCIHEKNDRNLWCPVFWVDLGLVS